MKIVASCRACSGALNYVFDLGQVPLANTYSETRAEAINLPRYPLRLCQCRRCGFLQLDVVIDSATLFSHYAYETPRGSPSLTHHYDQLVEAIATIHDAPPKRILEMGSNNGAFLELYASTCEVLGIDPAENVASSVRVARQFFTKETAIQFGKCDVFVARHCMAHIDDLKGTFEAIRAVLKPDGIAVIENAYALDTLIGAQFDQLYHEHHSYFLLRPFFDLAEKVGLNLFHAFRSPIHGGSIVMFFAHRGAGYHATDALVKLVEGEEIVEGALKMFPARATMAIEGLRAGLRSLAYSTVDTYGATAKGNTLLNVLGADALHIRYAVDSTPSKWNKFLPGTGIKVISEASAIPLNDEGFPYPRPDAYLLTAWNYADEIMEKQRAFRDAGGVFILPFPFPRIV